MKDVTLIAEICLYYDCKDCPFHDADKLCLLRSLPEFWDTKKINRILDENRGETNADD